MTPTTLPFDLPFFLRPLSIIPTELPCLPTLSRPLSLSLPLLPLHKNSDAPSHIRLPNPILLNLSPPRRITTPQSSVSQQCVRIKWADLQEGGNRMPSLLIWQKYASTYHLPHTTRRRIQLGALALPPTPDLPTPKTHLALKTHNVKSTQTETETERDKTYHPPEPLKTAINLQTPTPPQRLSHQPASLLPLLLLPIYNQASAAHHPSTEPATHQWPRTQQQQQQHQQQLNNKNRRRRTRPPTYTL